MREAPRFAPRRRLFANAGLVPPVDLLDPVALAPMSNGRGVARRFATLHERTAAGVIAIRSARPTGGDTQVGGNGTRLGRCRGLNHSNVALTDTPES